jgi:pseudaminic acid synthase
VAATVNSVLQLPETREICIGDRRVGNEQPVYIIAELSANHRQDFEQAVRLIHAAKQAGADAIKLQTYTPDTITISSNRKEFRIRGGTIWDGRSLHELYDEAFTPWEWQPKLKEIANSAGLALFSSPFDETAVDFLEQMNVPAYKVASFELVDFPLIKKIAETGKPMIMSTGMATAYEIEDALTIACAAGAKEIALLKCTSAYPSAPEMMNLRTIAELERRFRVPAGLSDHTLGIAVPVAAVALGACIIEKHLTLARSDGGVDSAFSLEPDEFKAMVDAVRFAEKAIGGVRFGPTEDEQASIAFRRSLFVVEDIKRGEVFTTQNLRSIRPAHGLHTRYLDQIIGQPAACDIEKGTPLDWSLVAKPVCVNQ